MKINIYFIISLLLFTVSCGKKAKDKKLSDSQHEITTEGTYWARLAPINLKVSSGAQGEMKVHLYGDEFKVNSYVKNAASLTHRQYLHTGSICPDIQSDINNDGYIDAKKSREALGEVVLPFDGDLSSINIGADNFPTGNYTYQQSTSFSLMVSDLDFKKKQFALERRVVTVWEESPAGEVPILCGILTRIADENGSNGQPGTWNTTPNENGGSTRVKPPRITPKPPINNPPVRPPVVTPPREDGGIIGNVINTVRRWARWIFNRSGNPTPSSKPNTKDLIY